MYDDIFAGILVGGRGKRHGGEDKARLRLPDGESYLARTARVLRERVSTLRLVGRPDQFYPELDAPMVVDRYRNAGPLGGLEVLIADPPAPWCLLAACDMPAIDLALIDAIASARTPDARVVVPRGPRGLHPTFALYHRDVHARAVTMLEANERALRALIAAVSSIEVEVSESMLGSLRNVNAPGD